MRGQTGVEAVHCFISLPGRFPEPKGFGESGELLRWNAQQAEDGASARGRGVWNSQAGVAQSLARGVERPSQQLIVP